MAKTNKGAIIKLIDSINSKEGDGTIYTIGSKTADLPIKKWSTGIEDLDNIIGGGMPEGRVIEISGAEGSGKTTLLYHLLSLHPIALDIPIEGTFDSSRAKIFGNTPDQLLIYRASYGEDALNKVITFSKQGIPIIGIDSVPSMIPREDAEKVLKSSGRDSIEEQRIGGIARTLNKYLPTIEDIIEITGTTVIFINQLRDKMGALMFGDKTDTPGGKKLKHSCSLRLKVARKSWVEVPNKNPSNTALNEKIGMIMKVKVIKSKVSNPMGECEIPLIFERGFVSFDELPEIRKEIMNRNKKTKKKSEE